MGLLSFIPAALSAVGTALGIKSQNKANKQNQQAGALDRKLQLDTLQNQIQWRMEDAKKAGVHPLAALGMSPSSYTPVGGMASAVDYSGIGDFGADISRAIAAGQTERERRAAAGRATVEATQNQQLFDLEVEERGLRNAMLRSQIARFNSAQIGPPMPDASPGDVDVLPDQVTVGSRNMPSRSPGELTDYAFGPTASGGYTLVPSQDMKQRIEDTPMEWAWMFRNGIVPNPNIFRDLERNHPSRSGYQWRFNPLTGEFYQQAIRRGDRRAY